MKTWCAVLCLSGLAVVGAASAADSTASMPGFAPGQRPAASGQPTKSVAVPGSMLQQHQQEASSPLDVRPTIQAANGVRSFDAGVLPGVLPAGTTVKRGPAATPDAVNRIAVGQEQPISGQ